MILEGELLLVNDEVTHDYTTLTNYPEHVALYCTCGYSAPPVGLATNPLAHVEHCRYRTNNLRLIDNMRQRLI